MISIEAELDFDKALTPDCLREIYESNERMFGKRKSFVELTKIAEDGRKYILVLKIKE